MADRKPDPRVEKLWCPICRTRPVQTERVWHGKLTKCCTYCLHANDGT